MIDKPALRVPDILLALIFGTLVFLAHDIWQKIFLSALGLLQLFEG